MLVLLMYCHYCIVNSSKDATNKNIRLKGIAADKGEEKQRLSSSAKVPRNGVYKSTHAKESRRIHSKSATLPALSRKRSGLPADVSVTKTPLDVMDYRRISWQESPDDRFHEAVFYDSPVFYSSTSVREEIAGKKVTSHDSLTLEVLRAEFSAPSRSTYGLPRAASPEGTNNLGRYWTLVNHAIESNVVTPLSNEWIRSAHRLVPVELRESFADILEGITKVYGLNLLVNCLIGIVCCAALVLLLSTAKYYTPYEPAIYDCSLIERDCMFSVYQRRRMCVYVP